MVDYLASEIMNGLQACTSKSRDIFVPDIHGANKFYSPAKLCYILFSIDTHDCFCVHSNLYESKNVNGLDEKFYTCKFYDGPKNCDQFITTYPALLRWATLADMVATTASLTLAIVALAWLWMPVSMPVAPDVNVEAAGAQANVESPGKYAAIFSLSTGTRK